VSVLNVSKMDLRRRGRLVIGALGLLVSAGYTWQAFEIPVGTLAKPGAGLYPRGVGIVAIVISFIVVIEAILAKASTDEEVEFPRGVQLRLVLIFFGLSCLYVIVLPILGQYLAASLYSIAMIKFLSPHGWIRSILYGVAAAVTISWLFITLLSIQLPRGIW